MTTPRSTDKAAQLAQAALVLFSARGIDPVSMDDIAAAAGVTKGSLYWHYASKKDVALAACRCYYATWRSRMGEALAVAPTPLGQLRAAVEVSVHDCLFDEANRVFTTEVVAWSIQDDDARRSWAGFLDEAERIFLGLVHRAVGAGELDCDDVDGAVSLLLASMEGLKQLALFRPLVVRAADEERTVERLLSIVQSAVPVSRRATSVR